MRFFKKFFNIFCYISTCIFLFSSVYCLAFWGKNVQVGLSYIWGNLFIAFFASIISFFFMEENEISKAKVIFLRITYFVIINALVLGVGFLFSWVDFSNTKMLLGMEVTIIITFTAVMIVEYFNGVQDAEKMNELLRKRKEEE